MSIVVAGCSTHSQTAVTISPTSTNGFEVITVEFAFRGNDNGETSLTFPDKWGPEERLLNLISKIEVQTGASAQAKRLQPSDGKLTILHEAGEHIRVRYEVRQDYIGEPQWGEHRVPGMRPILQPGYGTLIGHTFLPSFDSATDHPLVVKLPTELSSGFARFSYQTSHDGISKPISIDQVRDSVFTFGAQRYSEEQFGDLLLRASIRGDWALSDDDLRETAAMTLNGAASLFDDPAFEQYYLVLAPLLSPPEGSAVIGTSLGESFFILATSNAETDNLKQTIVHEILHEWITRRMGQTDEATDPTRAWFVEGFTEYYTQLILLRSKLIDLQGFLVNMNRLARNYQTSPMNGLPIGALPDQIWQSGEAQRLPYQRGALLAFHWDSLARSTKERPLSEAIISLLRAAEHEREMTGVAVLTDPEINSALSELIGGRFEKDYRKHLVIGERINFDDLTIPSCLDAVVQKDGVFQWALSHGSDAAQCAQEITGPFSGSNAPLSNLSL